MIEVTCNVGTDNDPKWGVYRYCKSDRGAYWLGVRPLEGAHFMKHCVAPMIHWTKLRKQAIEDGFDPASFITKKPEVKPAQKRAARKKKNVGISIF